MARYKTVVYEEVTVYDVTYQKHYPGHPYYDGGDGPGSCREAEDDRWHDDEKKALTRNEKDRFLRSLRCWRTRDRGPATVRSRKVWKAISTKISARKPARARVS